MGLRSTVAIPERPAAEVVEAWRHRLDRTLTPTKDYLAAFKIQTKRKYADPLTGKLTNFIQYVEREIQGDIREEIERQWAAGHGAKIIVGKDRQKGITTAILLLIWECFQRDGPGNGKIVSRKDAQTRENFRILKSLERQTPGWIWYHLMNGARLVRSSTREIFLQYPDGADSCLEVITANDKSMGRGGTVRWLLIDEFAWWEPAAKRALGGLLDSWDDAPGNVCIILSTGNGLDEFYEEFDAAMKGINGFAHMFSGWLDHPEKVSPFESAAEKLEFAKSLGKIARYEPVEEANLIRLHKATLEQVRWRREVIDSPRCRRDPDIFRREHPTTWRDMFRTTTRSIYAPDVLDAWTPLAKKMEDGAVRCRLTLEKVGDEWSVTPEPSIDGKWLIFKMPVVGTVCAYGADVAEGFETHADGKTESDYSTIEVRQVLGVNEIHAIYEAHIEPREFGMEVIKGSLFFGRARGFVEANNHGHTTIDVIREAEFTDILLTRRRLVPTDTGKRWTRAPGFLSKKDTKTKAVDLSRDWVRDLGYPREGAPPALPICLVKQMSRYVRGGKTGKNPAEMGASTGHDDLVSADYLCHAAIDVVKHEVSLSSRVEPQMTEQEKYMIRGGASALVGASGSVADRDMGDFYG